MSAEGAAEQPAAIVMPPAVEVAAEAVRVAVRVRPLSEKEVLEGSQMCVRYPDGKMHRMIQMGGKDSGKNFTFDSVFHAEDPQSDVYNEVSCLVDKVSPQPLLLPLPSCLLRPLLQLPSPPQRWSLGRRPRTCG